MMTIRDIATTPVVLADYSRIEIPRMPVEVTEEEINDSIYKAREEQVEKIEKTTPAEKYDEVLIDLVGQIGSRQFPPEPLQDYGVILGLREFYEEIEQRLEGSKPGDIIECCIELPEYLLPPESDSSILHVHVTVKKVLEYKLPEVNEAFVKKVSPCNTVEEFYQYVEEQCKRAKENAKFPVKQNKALSHMIKHSTVEIKEDFVAEKAKGLKNSFAAQLKDANCTFEQYLEHVNMTPQQYEERALRDAKNLLSGSCILYQVAEKERLEAPEEAVNAEIARLDMTGMLSVEELRASLSEDDLERILFTVRVQQASLLLASRVVEV